MSEESVLGIDIGTSSTKAVLARPDGTVVAQTQRAHEISMPRPGWVEHDAGRTWWRDVLDICGEFAPIAGRQLQAICVSGIGPCLLPCDANMQPLRPAILYGIDTRADSEIEELELRYGPDAILARAGSSLSSQALGPKLLWLQRKEPEVWRRTRGWYMASSFVAARLTGAYVLDHHSASQCQPLYDLAQGDWADGWSAELSAGVPLPALVWPSEVVGTVTTAAAAETGLPAGTPVCAGTIDAWAEAFSGGVRNTGDLMLMYGSTMFFVQVGAANPNPLLWSTQGAEPGKPTVAAGMSTSGVLVDWLRSFMGSPSWRELVAEAAAVPPGADGLLLLPYFAGERTPIYDPFARGVIAGLTLRHGRAEILRAAYEGIALGIRQILELLTTQLGSARRTIAVGGGTQSELWLQVVSDAAGIEQLLPDQRIGAAYGDALMAAIGVGLVPSETDWSSIGRVVVPSVEHRETYDHLFGLYRRLYESTAEVVHALADLSVSRTS